jgi:hypothetical protein
LSRGNGSPDNPLSITVKHFQISRPNVEIGRHVEVKYFSNVWIVLKNQVNVDAETTADFKQAFRDFVLGGMSDLIVLRQQAEIVSREFSAIDFNNV